MSTNLQYITKKSGTNISDLSITDCFSSHYDVYQVFLDTIEFADGDMYFRFMNASGTVTSASYDDAVLLQRSYGGFAQNKHTGQTYLGSIGYDNDQNGGGATQITVYNPADSGSFTFSSAESGGSTAGYSRGG